MTLTALLLTLAVPSFGNMLSRNRMLVQSNNLLLSLMTARSTAVLHREMVHVCRLDQDKNPACDDNYEAYRNWSHGWMIFMDLDRDNEFSEGDELVYQFAGSEQITMVFNQRGRLRFFPNGGSRSAGFTLCDSARQDYRHIYIFHSGRTRIKQTASPDMRSKCDAATRQ